MSLPGYIKREIDMYVDDGVPPGNYVWKFLANDLMLAAFHADYDERKIFFYICDYVFNAVPVGARGNYEKVAEWIKRKKNDRDNP